MESRKKRLQVVATVVGTLAWAVVALYLYLLEASRLTALGFDYLIAADVTAASLGLLAVFYGNRKRSRAASLAGAMMLIVSVGAAIGIGGFIGIGTLMCCP